jgi:hypothetical protein
LGVKVDLDPATDPKATLIARELAALQAQASKDKTNAVRLASNSALS